MSKESLLQKEFKEKDVKRLRNLISGNGGGNTTTQIGYEKAEVDHKEGEVWEDAGKKWTIKNGILQTYNPLSNVKAQVLIPLWCPSCGRPMKTHIDEKFYRIKGKCEDCGIKEDTELRRLGLWDEYAENYQKNNKKALIKDAREIIMTTMGESDENYYTEDGDKQTITGASGKASLGQKMLEELDNLEKTL